MRQKMKMVISYLLGLKPTKNDRYARVFHMLKGHSIQWTVHDGILSVICSCGEDFTNGALLEIYSNR